MHACMHARTYTHTHTLTLSEWFCNALLGCTSPVEKHCCMVLLVTGPGCVCHLRRDALQDAGRDGHGEGPQNGPGGQGEGQGPDLPGSEEAIRLKGGLEGHGPPLMQPILPSPIHALATPQCSWASILPVSDLVNPIWPECISTSALSQVKTWRMDGDLHLPLFSFALFKSSYYH